MKENILSRLESVQSVMNGLDKLKDEHDPWKSFNFYWDYIDFINWMKVNEPDDYELYELEFDFDILDEFGISYVNLIEPVRLKYLYRHDDGSLNIDIPLPKMIKNFYDYVINLQENELLTTYTELHKTNNNLITANEALADANKALADAPTLTDAIKLLNLISSDVKQIGEDVNKVGANVVEVATELKAVDSTIQNVQVIDADELADRFVNRVNNPLTPDKKLSKKEKFEVDLANRMAQDDLKLLQKLHKNKK